MAWWDDEPYVEESVDDPYYLHGADPLFDPWGELVDAGEGA